MFLTKPTITSISQINTITSAILFNKMLKADKIEIIGIVLAFKGNIYLEQILISMSCFQDPIISLLLIYCLV